jgi:hypothetical protein
LTFNSARSGRDEVYVVRFRGERSPPALGGPPVQISTEGGIVIDWRRDGKEVIFRSPDNQIMVVTVDARGETVSASHPLSLFRLPSDQDVIAMTPNGDRFLLTEFPYAAGQTIHVLTNWQARIQ